MSQEKKEVFIHYGHKYFDPRLFKNIKNHNFVKPIGGLWASRVDAEYGWKDWNEKEGFMECILENSFQFKLKENSKILTIKTKEDLLKVPLDRTVPEFMKGIFYCLDFEEIQKNYDAIEVIISNDQSLYWDLYGWDCDSILILNRQAIELII